MSQIPPDIQALADEEAARIAEEWGQWVAVEPILWEGRLAYLPGHAVPASNVERYGYDKDGLVRRRDEAAPAETATTTAPPSGQSITAPASTPGTSSAPASSPAPASPTTPQP